MLKSELLHPDIIHSTRNQIEKLKSWIVAAATCNIESNDPEALEHLFNLNMLLDNIDRLQENIEGKVLSFDNEKATGIKD